MPRLILAVLLLTLAFGCRTAADVPTTLPAAIDYVRTDLYFGLSRPDGSAVTDEQFRGFLRDTVTPLFPDGLTLLAGDGQWRDGRTGRITREPCRVLILLHRPTPAADAAVDRVRDAYKRQFDQQSVLRADVAEHVSF